MTLHAEPRFVILRHVTPIGAARAPHWDFMLQFDGVLRTWALPSEPADQCSLAALVLPDHRLEYLDYEGPVSGDRGVVSRWDRGRFEAALHSEEELVVRLCGDRLRGQVRLVRQPGSDQRWTFSFVAESARA